MKDLKPIYAAANREEPSRGLRGQVGRRYETISASWRNNWERGVPFLDFPPEVRKVIYTTTRSSP